MEKLYWIGFLGALIAGIFAIVQAKKVMGFSEGNDKMKKAVGKNNKEKCENGGKYDQGENKIIFLKQLCGIKFFS